MVVVVCSILNWFYTKWVWDHSKRVRIGCSLASGSRWREERSGVSSCPPAGPRWQCSQPSARGVPGTTVGSSGCQSWPPGPTRQTSVLLITSMIKCIMYAVLRNSTASKQQRCLKSNSQQTSRILDQKSRRQKFLRSGRNNISKNIFFLWKFFEARPELKNLLSKLFSSKSITRAERQLDQLAWPN